MNKALAPVQPSETFRYAEWRCAFLLARAREAYALGNWELGDRLYNEYFEERAGLDDAQMRAQMRAIIEDILGAVVGLVILLIPWTLF